MLLCEHWDNQPLGHIILCEEFYDILGNSYRDHGLLHIILGVVFTLVALLVFIIICILHRRRKARLQKDKKDIEVRYVTRAPALNRAGSACSDRLLKEKTEKVSIVWWLLGWSRCFWWAFAPSRVAKYKELSCRLALSQIFWHFWVVLSPVFLRSPAERNKAVAQLGKFSKRQIIRMRVLYGRLPGNQDVLYQFTECEWRAICVSWQGLFDSDTENLNRNFFSHQIAWFWMSA